MNADTNTIRVLPRRRLNAVAPATGRRTLSNRGGYWVAASVIALGLYASLTPAPLYRTYSVLWHFSPLTLTLIYATYAFGVLAALLLTGRVSDDVGRRPVLLVALAGLAGATVLFLFADSAAWLFVARGLQGLATGLALGAAGATLLDLHPRRDPTGVAITNGAASGVGVGLGILVSSALVQIGWEPRVLPFVVLLALVGIALVGAYLMPEPVRDRKPFRLTPELPQVPAVVRRPFVLAALSLLSSWTIAALFYSLGPELGGRLFHTGNAIVSGLGIVVLTAAGVTAQRLTGRTAPWLATAGGSLALAAGIVLIVVAAATGSTTSYLAGAVIAGAGFGAAFLGGLRALVAQIPSEHRASVLSAYYVVAYLALSVPAIVAGVAVSSITLESTFEIIGSVVAAIALVVAFLAWRTRPVAAAEATEPDATPLRRAA
jgi:MFS family permease